MNNNKIIIISTYIWIGFVLSISFMEAWLKFLALGITLQLGLGIGKLVFNALNKVELFFALIIILRLFFFGNYYKKKSIFILIPILILVCQTFWILPILNRHIDMIVQNIKVPKNNLHLIYVIMEIIKVISLFYYGYYQLKNSEK
jgi:uncharacterized membrane protein YwzB